ncbi:hypothetical protein N1851_006230 [Merluccius polli]|uniref:Uncharacterized protein n=1 Tax=Merluccius polli TaxID=89951 RepID=A0AA47N648_MERPO|nr:hypothetical protein N1851_006230 [Merluccius polli]
MVLFEPLLEQNLLPAGLLASVSLVPIVNGVAHVPIVNVGRQEARVQPHAAIGTLCPVQVEALPDGIMTGLIEGNALKAHYFPVPNRILVTPLDPGFSLLYATFTGLLQGCFSVLGSRDCAERGTVNASSILLPSEAQSA